MKREHQSHVVGISLMLICILFVFGWVLFHSSSSSDANAGRGITTSLSSYSGGAFDTNVGTSQTTKNTTQIETEILLALLIMLAFLFIVWLIVKIVREIKGHFG